MTNTKQNELHQKMLALSDNNYDVQDNWDKFIIMMATSWNVVYKFENCDERFDIKIVGGFEGFHNEVEKLHGPEKMIKIDIISFEFCIKSLRIFKYVAPKYMFNS